MSTTRYPLDPEQTIRKDLSKEEIVRIPTDNPPPQITSVLARGGMGTIYEAEQAFLCESKIIDWMINGIQEKGLSAPILKEFIKNRINDSLEKIGFERRFEVDSDLLKDTMWFEEELLGNNATDFFYSRPVEYAKNSQTFDAEDLF